jgi:hypothetical protein
MCAVDDLLAGRQARFCQFGTDTKELPPLMLFIRKVGQAVFHLHDESLGERWPVRGQERERPGYFSEVQGACDRD